jgi:hypothetical protein
LQPSSNDALLCVYGSFERNDQGKALHYLRS